MIFIQISMHAQPVNQPLSSTLWTVSLWITNMFYLKEEWCPTSGQTTILVWPRAWSSPTQSIVMLFHTAHQPPCRCLNPLIYSFILSRNTMFQTLSHFKRYSPEKVFSGCWSYQRSTWQWENADEMRILRYKQLLGVFALQEEIIEGPPSRRNTKKSVATLPSKTAI